jgi:hypothetical protein
MFFSKLRRYSLSTSLGLVLLSGCQTPLPNGSSVSPKSPNAAAIAPASVSAPDQVAQAGGTFALAAENEIDAYDLLLEGGISASSHYAVAQVAPSKAAPPQPATVGASKGRVPKNFYGTFRGSLPVGQANKIAGRRAQLKANRADLKQRPDESLALSQADKGAAWVDNGDGTSTKLLQFNVNKAVNGQAVVRQVTMVRTIYNATKLMVSLNTDMVDTMPDGTKHSVSHDKIIQRDGSYRVVMHSEFTLKDGTKRVTNWDKTIDVEGNVKGLGEVGMADASGKVIHGVPLNFSGTEGAQVASAATTNKAAAKPAAQGAAQAKAAQIINLSTKMGDAGLKVRNRLKRKQAIANPLLSRATKKYRLFDVSSDGSVSTNPGVMIGDSASSDTNTDANDADVEQSIKLSLTASAPVPANDGTLGDQRSETAETISNDGGSQESGSAQLTEITDIHQMVKSGEIAYTPDSVAAGAGEVSEDIKFTVPADQLINDNHCDLTVTLPADPANQNAGPVTAVLNEDEGPGGDVKTEGDVTLPDGSMLHLAVINHGDGTRDISETSHDFGFQLKGLSANGVGSGFVYDRDPADPNAIPIGVIALHNGEENDTISFYETDGIHLETPQAFNFLL